MLSKIKVNFFVAEAILGHQISGVAGIVTTMPKGCGANVMPMAQAG
jgi:hypothetical protein